MAPERGQPASVAKFALYQSLGGFEWRTITVQDLTPEDVSKGMAEGRYLLVDVREPNEVAVEAYPGAVVVPLSSFDPKTIPDPGKSRWCLPAAPGRDR